MIHGNKAILRIYEIHSHQLVTFPAWSAICLNVFASLSWACIWARSSCIFLQLSAYWRLSPIVDSGGGYFE